MCFVQRSSNSISPTISHSLPTPLSFPFLLFDTLSILLLCVSWPVQQFKVGPLSAQHLKSDSVVNFMRNNKDIYSSRSVQICHYLYLFNHNMICLYLNVDKRQEAGVVILIMKCILSNVFSNLLLIDNATTSFNTGLKNRFSHEDLCLNSMLQRIIDF